MNGVIDSHVEALLKTRDALEGDLRKVKAMLEAAGVSARRKTEQSVARGRPKGKKNSGLGVSAEKIDHVFDVVQALTEPTGTTAIAARVEGLTPQTVSKVLSHLAKNKRIRHAGFMPGVKGKRPLYAPWPSDRTAAAMGAEPHELPLGREADVPS